MRPKILHLYQLPENASLVDTADRTVCALCSWVDILMASFLLNQSTNIYYFNIIDSPSNIEVYNVPNCHSPAAAGSKALRQGRGLGVKK